MSTYPPFPQGQGQYPPSGIGYPPSGAVYPPGGTGYPPTAAGFPPSGGYPPYSSQRVTLDPPKSEKSTDVPDIPTNVQRKAPSLTEEEAQEALLEYVSQHCCYGSAPAKKMIIRDIVFNSAIYYKLESYGEKRETAWAYEPYKGQGGAVLPAGYPQGLWDINVTRNKGNFVDSKKDVEVPNTSNVRPCHECVANGHVTCKACQGCGRTKCTECQGKGNKTRFDEQKECDPCKGSGYCRCKPCSGKGKVTCEECKGRCQLRYYVKLTVTWKNHVVDKIFETLHVPKDLIGQVSGHTAFKDERPRVSPIKDFPDKNVNTTSKKLIEVHKTAFPEERILIQRQEVSMIPVAEVHYTWENSTGSFFVYGFEKKVYFPNYPQTCCWGCQIL